MDAKSEKPTAPAGNGDREDKLARLRDLVGAGGALCPATPVQERFWILEHSGDDPSFYHVAEAVETVGNLDYDRLERCLDRLSSRHEALRTTIGSIQGKPVQIIHPRAKPLFIRLEPVPGRPLEETLRQEARRPFSFGRDPLWRVAALPLAPDRHALLVVFHHLISDGWSLAIFLREILTIYMADMAGLEPVLPPAMQYREYEASRRRRLTPGREEAQVAYWKETLRDLPKPPPLPFDSGRPGPGAAGAWLPFDMDERGEASARQLAREGETTLFGVFMAALNVTLHALSGERDLLVGTVVSGRHGSRDWESVLGPLINSLILRTRIDAAETFRGFLVRSKEDVLGMLAHQDLPFDRIVELAGAPRRSGIMPITQVGIVYHEYPVRAIQGLPMTLHPLPFDTGRAQLDLSLVILNEDGRIRCRFEYDSRLFREETVRMVRNVFLAVLATAGAKPEETVGEVCRAAFPEMLPLHFTQHMRQIWQGEQVFADPLLYRNAVMYTIPKALDTALFLEAADFVVRHTDGLRAYIESNGGHPRLRFAPPRPGINSLVDFSGEEDPEGAFHAWQESLLARPSDLDVLPFCTYLARLGPKRYVWHLSHHHMFSDGRSVMILVERVSEVYGLLVQGRLEPGKITYPQMADQLAADFQYQRSSRFRKDAAYWAKRLEGLGEPLTFYGRSPRKAGTAIDRVPCRIGEERSAGLRAMASRGLADSKGLDAFLCNAFGVILAVYLHKVSGGAARIVFGSVTHNRRTQESKDIFGLYMQVIPHVLEVGEGESFRSLMRKMDREMQASLRYGQYAVDSSMGRPVYDVLLNYHKETPVLFDGSEASYEVIVRRATQSFGINITNYDLSGNLELQFDFHRDVFSPEKQPLAIGHFLSVIDAMLADPDAVVESVCLLDAHERRSLLVEFNDTAVPFPLEKDFHAVFRGIAALRPLEICASDDHESITYAGLLRSSNILAYRLSEAGVTSSHVVPILADRGIPFLEAMLAVFRLGAAYLPLDPASPAERLAFILRECGAVAILSQAAHAYRLPQDSALRIVPLREGGEAPHAPGPGSANRGVLPSAWDTDRLAYVIYTSGSTGRPKGAMIAQWGMMNHLFAKQRDLGLGPGDVISQNASQSFDISVWQFLSALVSGARTLILPDPVVLDPELFLGRLESGGATILEVVPSYLRALLDHWDRYPGRFSLPTLRFLLVTGEALPPDLVRRWLRRKPEVPMVNAYGPTECSDDVSHHFIRTPPAPWEHLVPIGRPIANTQLYVLDRGLQPVPGGVEGELFVGGAGLGIGYLGDEPMAQKAFLPNPLPEGTSPLLYRTGDRVRMRDDGCIEFRGRFDHQVKLRGYRIELGEIEGVIHSHPGVGNAVVTVRTIQGADALVAYVVPSAESPASAGDIRERVAAMLPGYMVPQHWVFLDRIPLTINGKVDAAFLPEPASVEVRPAVHAPLAGVEKLLAEIWEAVLERPVHDAEVDFFALGGDSMRAIQALSLASTKGMRIRMQDFLRKPTLRGMAASLGAVSAGIQASVVIRASVDAPGEVPLVPPQLRFLVSSQGNPSHDNVAIWLSLDARLAAHAPAALEAACAERDVFRLRLSRSGQEWRQTLATEIVPPVLSRRRLENAPDREALLLAWSRETQGALDLERGVLASCLLVEDGLPDRSLLLVSIHHLVTDAVSSRLLLGRMEDILADLVAGRLPRTLRQSEGAATFSAYARELRRAVVAGEFDGQRRYWQAVRISRPAFIPEALPADNLVADQRSLVANIPSRLLVPDGDEGTLPGGIAQAALAALVEALGRWSGPGEYAVGIVGTGREWSPPDSPVEGTVGWFNSYYPVVFDVTGHESPCELSLRVREKMEDVPMGGFGYGVLRYMHPDRKVRSALEEQGDPAIMFNYLGRIAGRTEGGGLQVVDLDKGGTRAPGNRRLAWLHAECWSEGGTVGLRLDFHALAFPETMISRLLLEWQQGLVAQADSLVAERTRA